MQWEGGLWKSRKPDATPQEGSILGARKTKLVRARIAKRLSDGMVRGFFTEGASLFNQTKLSSFQANRGTLAASGLVST